MTSHPSVPEHDKFQRDAIIIAGSRNESVASASRSSRQMVDKPSAIFFSPHRNHLVRAPFKLTLGLLKEVGMRRVLLASISLLALSVGGAVAADLPRAAPAYKAPVAIPMFNWTGGYIGVNAGYGWGTSDWGLFAADAKPSGGVAGLTLGYNWQALGSPWVFGLEGDINWSGMNGSFNNFACPVGCEIKNDWFGTVRGRVGYAVDRLMPYVTGGLAYGNVKANINGIGTTSDTNFGWTVGAGLEGALAPNWTAKIEYLYMDLGNTDCGLALCGGFSVPIDYTANIVRAGLNYKF